MCVGGGVACAPSKGMHVIVCWFRHMCVCLMHTHTHTNTHTHTQAKAGAAKGVAAGSRADEADDEACVMGDEDEQVPATSVSKRRKVEAVVKAGVRGGGRSCGAGWGQGE